MPLVVDSNGNACSPGQKRPRDPGLGSAATAYEAQRQAAELHDANQATEPSACKTLPLYKRARLADKHKVRPPTPMDSAPCHHDLLTEKSSPPQQQRTWQEQPVLKPSPTLPPSLPPSLHPPSPCHICHRRPNKKSTPNSFTDCHGCGRKTCFICIRECPSWPSLSAQDPPNLLLPAGATNREARKEAQDYQAAGAAASQELQRLRLQKESDVVWGDCGHRTVVCSRCCVEKGRQGDVICLGCLCGMLGA